MPWAWARAQSDYSYLPVDSSRRKLRHGAWGTSQRVETTAGGRKGTGIVLSSALPGTECTQSTQAA